MRKNTQSGFTLIELLIVVAIISLITAVALPKLLEARMRAQEQLAMQTLEAISNGEFIFKQMKVIDTDGDGIGEYGYLDDLMGMTTYRTSGDPHARNEAEGLGLIVDSVRGDFGRVKIENKNGYCFQIFLFQKENGKLKGVPCYDEAIHRPEKRPDPELSEIYWCAYAWPLRVGETGEKAFYMSSAGEMLQTSWRSVYEGNVVPRFDWAFTPEGDLGQLLGTDFNIGVRDQVWIPVVESN